MPTVLLVLKNKSTRDQLVREADFDEVPNTGDNVKILEQFEISYRPVSARYFGLHGEPIELHFEGCSNEHFSHLLAHTRVWRKR